jgi:hypothetical protein
MAERTNSKTPIDRKKAETGAHVVGRKDEAIRAEIEANPKISARQIAEKLEQRGMQVSMSHIYRQLSNFTRRNRSDRSRPWVGTTIGLPAPAGFSQQGMREYLGSPEEYGGSQRTKEMLAAVDEVGRVLDRHQQTGATRRGSKTLVQRTSRTKRSKMTRH